MQHVTPRAGQFWPQGDNMSKLGRYPLHTKYQGSRPYSFRQEDFFMFSLYKAYVKHVTPGRGHFLPQGHNVNTLGLGLLGDATYQISRL